jgi:hypothetical protein
LRNFFCFIRLAKIDPDLDRKEIFAYSNCEVNMTIRHDTEELAITARGIGAQVIQGAVHYPGRNGGLDVGDVDIEGPLCQLKDQEVLLIVAPVRPVQQVRTTCRLCGTLCERGECPSCKAKREEAKRAAEERLLFDEEFSPLLSEG